MIEKEWCFHLLCNNSISDLNINYYRKTSPISISVSSLGLFGGPSLRWCVHPWLCDTGREGVL